VTVSLSAFQLLCQWGLIAISVAKQSLLFNERLQSSLKTAEITEEQLPKPVKKSIDDSKFTVRKTWSTDKTIYVVQVI
jgi:hypothetical protein